MDNHFTIQHPSNQFLSTIVDYYLYIDISVSGLSVKQEYVLPFPRITFGYFFNHPFLVHNLTLKEAVSVNMVISRISTNRIEVQPETERIRILGAHVRPFCLAYLTRQPIQNLPWLINTIDLFADAAIGFKHKIESCPDVPAMFREVEKIFLDNVIMRDLSLITTAVDFIEKNAGDIQIAALSKQLNVSDRTIRNHFYDHIGCSPKEYIRLVKLKQVAFQMMNSGTSLTDITYNNNYFDQAHFIHEVQNITGRSPNELRKEIPHFRFLQF